MADKTTSAFIRPDWVPTVASGMRILVVGASGGIGGAVCSMLAAGSECMIGAHGGTAAPDPEKFFKGGAGRATIIPLQRRFETEDDCAALVEEFCARAGGIDALVHLSGALSFSGHWEEMPADAWRRDMEINLNQPFFLARPELPLEHRKGGLLAHCFTPEEQTHR